MSADAERYIIDAMLRIKAKGHQYAEKACSRIISRFFFILRF